MANKQISKVTLGGVTYDIKDEAARARLTALEGIASGGVSIKVVEELPMYEEAARVSVHATTPHGMYEGPVRRSGGIGTPNAPVPPNPVAFDHGILPFDFARTCFDQWTSPPGCVRSAHRNTLEQHPGQTHSKIPSV